MHSVMQSVEEHRQAGNAAFARKDFLTAIDHYTNAILRADGSSTSHTLFTNRCAAHLGLQDFVSALSDADSAIHLNSRFAKAYFRKALALEGLQQTDAALAAITQAQKLEPNNAQIQQAGKRIHQAAASLPQSTESPAPSQQHILKTEAPEEIHLRKRIKLQPGWLYHSSSDGIDENLLILLHGYGDTPEPFIKLGRQMALPQTACLALPGPLGPVAGTTGGRAWHHEQDEEVVDSMGHAAADNPIASTLRWLQQVLQSLQGSNGWRASHIHLFGFSQGGSAALHLALHCRDNAKLGSCVAVAAALLPQQLLDAQRANNSAQGSSTSVLMTRGSKDELLTQSSADATVAALKKAGSVVQFHCIPGKAHGMISGAAEMRLLMAFWAQSLRNRPLHVNAEDDGQSTFVEVHSGADVLSQPQAH